MAECACIIVEGYGDIAAVPLLLRRVLQDDLGNFDFQIASNPIRAKDVPCVRRPNELERYLRYACMREGSDCVIVILDCDDDCPVEIAAEFAARALPIAEEFNCPIAIALIKKEFESLFLNSIHSIANATSPSGRFKLDEIESIPDLEEVRGAKAMFRRALPSGSYKETRDQPKYVNSLDLTVLPGNSRSYRHIRSMLEWLTHAVGEEDLTYPET